MLKIGEHTLERFREPLIRQQVEDLARSILKVDPERAGGMPPDQLRSGIEFCVRKALEVGISHCDDVADYVALAWHAGLDLHERPWAAMIMGAPLPGGSKIRLLEEAAEAALGV